jgi:hypothetical protein
MNNNMQLLEKSLIDLKDIAQANPDKTYLLPLAGLGHGEGKVEDILPMLVDTVKSLPNIKLVIPNEDVNIGRQGTVRKDSTKENLPKIKQMLKESGLINEEVNESGIFVPTEGLKKINPYEVKPGVEPVTTDENDVITIDNFDDFFPEYKDLSTNEKIQLLRGMNNDDLNKTCKIR